MKGATLGRLMVCMALSYVLSLADARGSRVNKRSAIDDYLEFFGHDPEFSVHDHVKPVQSPKQHVTQKKPLVRQEDSYDGYVVQKDAFSNTDAYQYALQFKIGAKLDQNYLYVDECFDGWVHLMDDIAFYQNNVTEVELAIKDNQTNNWWFNYLNLTGIMFGPIGEIIVECYRFGNSVYKYESERLIAFGNEAGQFFLAFLFNQMGNSLYFQAKFERIQNYQEKQNYQSIWLEYGDLFYLIWDFDPLPEASYDSIETFLEDWVETHVAIDPENDMHRVMSSAGIPVVASFIQDLSQKVDKVARDTNEYVTTAIKNLQDNHKVLADQAATNFATFTWNVWPTPPTLDTTGWLDLLYGVAQGAVDVFPYRSNPQRCFRNATQVVTIVNNWRAVNWNLDIVNDEDDRLTFFKEISYVVGTPFGICYSCYWGGWQIFAEIDPYEDGEYTEDEELADKLTIGHEIPTNLLFNMGYMYGDIWSLNTLDTASALYWSRFGRYVGDFLIRIFWRREFTRNFNYDQEFDEDDNDY